MQVASLSWCLFFGGVGGYSAVHAAAVIVIQYNSGYKSYEFFFFFLQPHLWYMEVPGLGVESELWLKSTLSHSNTRSELHPQLRLQLAVTSDP